MTWLSTGTIARTRKPQNTWWLAATSRLSGSAQVASGNGKRELTVVSVEGLVTPVAVSAKGHQVSVAESQPACLAEWDFDRNDEGGFYPEVVTLGSGKLVHWICSRCPKGQPHRWTAWPASRIGSGSGCPVCAGQQACACNSPEALFQSVAAEFDVDKNGFTPSEMTGQFNKKVWWSNAKRGSWQQRTSARTQSCIRSYIPQQ